MRAFVPVALYPEAEVPQRKTASSAGYDLAAAKDVVVPPHDVVLVPTGLKVIMPHDEFLAVFIRSSLALRRGLSLANGVAVIDADYSNNPDNEGHILIALCNRTAQPVTITRGERIAQGVFLQYGRTDDDQPGSSRTGGFGSTGDK